MEILNPRTSLDAFFQRIPHSPSLLLLDYDGTMAPFKVHTDQAHPYPGVLDRLNTLQTLPQTTLVIISGRALSSLLPLLKMSPFPEIFGSHGGERLSKEGKVTYLPLSKMQGEGLKKGEKIAESSDLRGARLERKPFSIALHLRGLNQDIQTKLAHEFSELWGSLLFPHQLELCPFHSGLELRAKGINKGKVVETLLQESPWKESKYPIAYLGDDLTDEDAFSALSNHGLKILVFPEPKPTLADIRITAPDELISFLDRWIDCVYKDK